MVIATGQAFQGKQELDAWLTANKPLNCALEESALNAFANQLELLFPELSLLPSNMTTSELRSKQLTEAFCVSVMGAKHTVAGFKFMQGDACLTRYATYAVIFHVEEEPGPIHLTIYCARLPGKTVSHRDDAVSFGSLEELIDYFCNSTWDHAVCLRLSCREYIGAKESPVLVLNRPRDWNLTGIASQFLDIIRSIMASLRKDKN